MLQRVEVVLLFGATGNVGNEKRAAEVIDERGGRYDDE